MEGANSSHQKKCCRCHMTTLGSLGYCVIGLGLTTFILSSEVQHLLKYFGLPWAGDADLRWDLYIYIGLLGGSAALLPFFICSTIFKTGNFSNDNFRWGVHDGACSRDHSPLPISTVGFLRGLWRHGGPTGPFVHLVIAHSLLMAKTLMESSVIRERLLPTDTVWSSELSFLLPQQQRISFMNHLQFYSNSPDPLLNSRNGDHVFKSTQSSLLDNLRSNEEPNGTSVATSSPMDIAWSNGYSWEVGNIVWSPLTPHFINYIFALIIYAGRYAAVFWGTNKGLSLVMVLQMLFNAVLSGLVLNGFEVMFKIKRVGEVFRVLPIEEGFLLSLEESVALYLSLQTLVLISSSAIYLYAYSKFEAFLNAEKEKYQILNKHGHKAMWAYWPQCCSLILLVLMTASASPLIYDWTVIYRASLDSASLVASCGSVVHLFLWILSWMMLTAKMKWYFKLRVQVSKTVVTNSHSIRLVNEVQLSHQVEENEGPVMVIGSGKTYLLHEGSPKAALMRLVKTNLAEKKARGEEEEIYWLRPKGAALDPCWEAKKSASPVGVKHKVTFRSDSSEQLQANSPSGRNPTQDSSESKLSNRSNSMTKCEEEKFQLRNVSFPGPSENSHVHHSSKEPSNRHINAELIGPEFPAPPPELTNPANYPPPPDTPPPPLPPEELQQTKLLNTGAKLRVKNPLIDAVREDSYDGLLHSRDVTNGDLADASSSSSSLTPLDKRSDSGIHSQTSTGTHSKCGSSGSESCVPYNQDGYQGMAHISPQHSPPPPPAPQNSSDITRCSSVDKLCSMPPPLTSSLASPKSYSLHYGEGLHNSSTYQQCQINPQNDSTNYSQLSKVNGNHNGFVYHTPGNSNNNNHPHHQDSNGRLPQTGSNDANSINSLSSNKNRINIEVVGGGYGFLPPAMFVASEPVYSDASTPVTIRRRSSITAIEPETPPYERSASSFSTFTEPYFSRSVVASIPGKAMTVGGHMHKVRRPMAESKHATIAASVLPKGFHQPGHADSRYFSITTAKNQGTRIYPTPEPSYSLIQHANRK